MKIIDNFLTKTYFNTLQRLLEGDMFDWYYQESISSDDDNSQQSFGFSSWIIDPAGNSRGFADLFTGFLAQAQDVYEDSSGILRCRADMVLSNGQPYTHTAHVDINETPHYSCVFYVNESDGNTIIYNEKSQSNIVSFAEQDLTILQVVEPKPNRLVIFDGQYIHTGCSPVSTKRRIIVNTNILRTIEN